MPGGLHRKGRHQEERKLISNYGNVRWKRRVAGGKKKTVECWWTFEHSYMPEGIPLTTLIKVIIGAIGACQMPSLPSQLPRSPWTQLLTSSWRLGGRRKARRRGGQGIFSRKVGGSGGISGAYGKCPPTRFVSVYRGQTHIRLIIIYTCMLGGFDGMFKCGESSLKGESGKNFNS